MDEIVALAKRRNFAFPSSELYGGLANTWDFGHYGVLLKNNLRDAWWKRFVLQREDMVGVEASIFLNPKVWEASGHVSGFSDAMVDCKSCHNRTRADHLIEGAIQGKKVEGLPLSELTKIINEHNIKCPKCGSRELTEVRKFNLLFETQMGIIEGDKSKIYLRGEIAQGIFLNFKQVLDTMRISIPFGIAQQGKAFRNEITMGQFIHRTVEFDLMEFEYFIKENQWKDQFEYWQKEMYAFAEQIGLTASRLRWRTHEDFERSFYSKQTVDLEYQYPFGWGEMFGLAYRTDYDLANHEKHSGKKIRYKDNGTGEEFVPHVIEPTFGLSRLTGIVLTDSFYQEDINGKVRNVLRFAPKIAPIKAAIFPLQKDTSLSQKAREIYEKLKLLYPVEYDNRGNIGKMYRRQDEIGTPFCITVDYASLEDGLVTVRHRDSMKQERIAVNKLEEFLAHYLL